MKLYFVFDTPFLLLYFFKKIGIISVKKKKEVHGFERIKNLVSIDIRRCIYNMYAFSTIDISSTTIFILHTSTL